jgi:hypothetical protein
MFTCGVCASIDVCGGGRACAPAVMRVYVCACDCGCECTCVCVCVCVCACVCVCVFVCLCACVCSSLSLSIYLSPLSYLSNVVLIYNLANFSCQSSSPKPDEAGLSGDGVPACPATLGPRGCVRRGTAGIWSLPHPWPGPAQGAGIWLCGPGVCQDPAVPTCPAHSTSQASSPSIAFLLDQPALQGRAEQGRAEQGCDPRPVAQPQSPTAHTVWHRSWGLAGISVRARQGMGVNLEVKCGRWPLRFDRCVALYVREDWEGGCYFGKFALGHRG